MSRLLFLVAYDVRQPRRLRHLHQVLKDYACGGQKSAFECYLSATERKQLMQRAEQVMDAHEDALLIIRLNQRDAVKTLGRAVQPMDEEFTYLG